MTLEQFLQNVRAAIDTYRTYADNMLAKGILCAAQWADRQADDLTDMLLSRRPFPDWFGPFAGWSITSK